MSEFVQGPPLGLGVIALGAGSRGELARRLEGLGERLQDPKGLARALAAGEKLRQWPVRAAFFAEDAGRAQRSAQALAAYLEKGGNPARLEAQGIALCEGAPRDPGQVAFMSPGQGSQYLGMMEELRQRFPVAQLTLDEADAAMEGLLPRKLSSYLAPGGDEGEAFWALSQVEVLQPAVLTHDEALRRLLWPYLRPKVVFGHSLGEYGACVAAGVLRFADALRVIAARGDAMQRVEIPDPGKMLALGADEATVSRHLEGIKGYVVVVNKNCPTQTIIGGASAAVEEAERRLQAAGLEGIYLPVSHAFHSEIVAPASEPLYAELRKLEVRAPQTMILSNVDAEPYPRATLRIRKQLSRQMASPVEFIKVVERAYAEGVRVFVEVGPKRAQASFVADILKGRDHRAVYLCHPKFGELESLGRAVAALWAEGVIEPQGLPLPEDAGLSGKRRATSRADLTRVSRRQLTAVSRASLPAVQTPPGPAAPPSTEAAPAALATPPVLRASRVEMPEAITITHPVPAGLALVPVEAPPPPLSGALLTEDRLKTDPDLVAVRASAPSDAPEDVPLPFYVRRVAQVPSAPGEARVEGPRLLLHQGLPAETLAALGGEGFLVRGELSEWELTGKLARLRPAVVIDLCALAAPHEPRAAAQEALRRVATFARALLKDGASVRRILAVTRAEESDLGLLAAGGATAGAWRSFTREWMEGHAHPSALTVVDLARSTPAALSRLVQAASAEGPRALYLDEEGRAAEESLTPPIPNRAPWLRDGMVVLGFGAGRGVASWIIRELARRYQVKVALFGRTPTPDDGRSQNLEELLFQARFVLGPAATPRQVSELAEVLGRQAELGQTMDDLASSGAEVLYLPGDVRDADQVHRTLDDVRARWGRLDLVLYGAGIESQRKLETKGRAELDEVIATQVTGLGAAIEALRGARLVTVGSLAGRRGHAEQIDSSAAHEAAARLTRAAHGIFLGFSPWRGVGASVGREEALRGKGLDLLDPLDAARWAAERIAAWEEGEWVIAGRIPPPLSFQDLMDAEISHSIPGEELALSVLSIGRAPEDRIGALTAALLRGTTLLAPGAAPGPLRMELQPGAWRDDLTGATYTLTRAPRRIVGLLRQGTETLGALWIPIP